MRPIALAAAKAPRTRPSSFRFVISFTALSSCFSIMAFVMPEEAFAANTQANASFGSPVAIDGEYAVVGVPSEDSPSSNAGAAYVYRYDGSGWEISGYLLPQDPAASDNFGRSVAISGNTIVVGSSGDDDNGSASGSAYVFVRTIDGWAQQAKLTASDGAASDAFGSVVAIDGDLTVIGATGWEDGSSGSGAGAAYVFKRAGTSWSQQQILEASDQAANDSFGGKVDIEGNAIVVAALDKQVSGASNVGKAYVFRYASGTWSQEGGLVPGDPSVRLSFGYSVSISGSRVAVGAVLADLTSIADCGAVYVFAFSGSTWSQTHKVTASDPAADDLFGSSVSVEGDRFLVGSYQDDDNGSNSGSAYVFDYASSAWTQTKKITRSDGASGDFFGRAVGLSGTRAIIGAPSDDDGNYAIPPSTVTNAGSAYFFDKDHGGTNNWGQTQKILAELLPPGRCCALDGQSIACSEVPEPECVRTLAVWNEGVKCSSGCASCAAGEEGGARRWGAALPVGFFSQVNLHTGRLITTLPVVGWSGRGPGISLSLFHNAACGISPAFADWTHSYSTRLEIKTGEITLVSPDGTHDVFTDDTQGGYDPPPGIFATLSPETSPGTGYLLTAKDQTVARFDSTGRLSWIEDASLNRVTLTYISNGSDPADGKLDFVTDAAGRELDFDYNGYGNLSEIIAPLGGTDDEATRSWKLLYEDSGNPGTPSQNGDGPFVVLENPLEHPITITYTTGGEMASVENENQNSHTFEYVGGRVVRVTGPTALEETFSYVQAEDRTVARYYDVRGAGWTFEFDAIGNLSRVMDPLVNESRMLYEAAAPALAHEATSRINPLEHAWDYDYDSFGNLTKATDPLSNRTDFAYDSLNNLESVTPPGATANTVNTAKKVEINYTDSNHPTSPTEIIEPADGQGSGTATTYLTYYDDDDATGTGIGPDDWTGELKDVTDPNGVVTRFTYDTWGQQRDEIENPSSSTPYADDFWPTLSSSSSVNKGGVAVQLKSLQRFEPNCASTAQRTGTTELTANGWAYGWSECETDGFLVQAPSCEPSQRPGIGRTLSNCATLTLSATGQMLALNQNVMDPLTADESLQFSQRNLSIAYDDLDRPLELSLLTEEPTKVPGYDVGQTIAHREFQNEYDDFNGLYSSVGPDGDVSEVQFDDANRPQIVTRTVGNRSITVEYSYDAAGRLVCVDQGNGNWIERSYDDADRITRISHYTNADDIIFQQVFDWTADGLVEEISEVDEVTVASETVTATVTFEYDNRNRLIQETRDDSGATGVSPVEYDIAYGYDEGGNRVGKVDVLGDRTTTYTYDVDVSGATDGYQHNNRLLYQQTVDNSTQFIEQKRWYQYGSTGNLFRMVQEAGALSYTEVYWFYYDTDGKLWNTVSGSGEYQVQTQELDNIVFTGAAEYRYDEARQRYLVRERDPNNGFEVTDSGQWRDYLGNGIYRDFAVNPETSVIAEGDAHLSGVGYDDAATNGPNYFASDQVGTTRRICNTASAPAVLHRNISTAFGEPVSTVNAASFDHPRYGYAGAHGYEQPRSGDPLEELGWLHVGERYYAPELGRFVQRDPIGVFGGVNTYEYTKSDPISSIDPNGLDRILIKNNSGINHEALMIQDAAGNWVRIDLVMGNPLYAGDNYIIRHADDPNKLMDDGDYVKCRMPTTKTHDHKTYSKILQKYVGGCTWYWWPCRVCHTFARKMYNDNPPAVE